MKPFNFKCDKFSVNYDPSTSEIKILGRATPIDPFTEYKTFLTWFEDFLETPQPLTKLIIEIDFFNSIFTKVLVKLFMEIENSDSKDNFVIVWISDDRELSELADDLKNIVSIPFELIKK